MKFDLHNTTRIIFGVGEIARLSEAARDFRRILVLYGGGSIKRNGVYDQVMTALKGKDIVEFGGIEPNPEYDTIAEAAGIARKARVDLVLGVGGGSVIDAAKFLATIMPIEDGDAWDKMASGLRPARAVRNSAVLTLPATGSESNPVSVISRSSRGLKLPFAFEGARPLFAVLDPSTMKSLDRRQLENGVVDAVTHVLEQYLTLPVNAPVQTGFSEVLLRVLFEWGPRLISEDSDEARENVMWAANLALNGLVGAGVPQDWSTHMIGHALTALYGIDHARTLSMVMPSLMEYKLASKREMLARYARKVWGVATPDDENAALEAIERTRSFFREMGCPVRLAAAKPTVISADHVVQHVAKAKQLPLGENRDIVEEDIRAILSLAA